VVPEHLLTAIDPVRNAVPDMHEALEFYAAGFDRRPVQEEVNEEKGIREAMLAVGDTDDRVQLMAPLDADSPLATFLARRGQGIQQLAYRVSDLEAASTVLRDRGLRLLYDTPKRGTAGSRINFVHPKDAGGVLVELVEPAGARKASTE